MYGQAKALGYRIGVCRYVDLCEIHALKAQSALKAMNVGVQGLEGLSVQGFDEGFWVLLLRDLAREGLDFHFKVRTVGGK